MVIARVPMSKLAGERLRSIDRSIDRGDVRDRRVFPTALSGRNKSIVKIARLILPVRGGKDGTKGTLDEADGGG